MTTIGRSANGIFQPSCVTEFPNEFTASVVDVRPVVLVQVCASPEFQVAGQCLVARLKKRPIQMARGDHRLVPLKFWFLFADKRVVSPMEIVRGHADGLGLRFSLNGLIDSHTPFLL